MRPITAQWRATVAASHPIVTTVTSWRNSVQLATVPINAGQVTFDQSADGRRRCRLQVPRTGADGFNWMPTEDNGETHPLAPYGQRLNIQTGVRHPNGTTELMNLGWYLITSITGNGSVVDVQGDDLWRLLDDAKIPSGARKGFGPAQYALEEVGEGLVWNGVNAGIGIQILPVDWQIIPNPLTTRPFPIPENSSRTDHIKRLVRIVRGRFAIDDTGTLLYRNRITTPAAVPIETFTDGTGGTILDRVSSMQRDGLINQSTVIATSPSTGKEVTRATATGPDTGILGRRIFGPVMNYRVTNQLSGLAEAQELSAEILADGSAATRIEQIEIVPNPAIELLDTVLVQGAGGTDFRGLITALRVPLNGSNARMGVTVASGL